MTNFAAALGFQPTHEQGQILQQVEAFVQKDNEQDLFILNGAAGTGKSSITKAVTHLLKDKKIAFKMGASTGRAAKVIAQKTGCDAKTLHSHIYIPQKINNGGGVQLNRKINTDSEFTVYIVDEASMISDQRSVNERFQVNKPLLTDFLDFVKQGNPRNKVLFIGDKNQLPPVSQGDKDGISPALEVDYLKHNFTLKGQQATLTQVMRQAEGSSVLDLATQVRQAITTGQSLGKLEIPTVRKATQAKWGYLNLYEPGNLDKLAIICWTNRDVAWWNSVIRENLGHNSKLFLNDVMTLQTTWYNGKHLIYKGDTGMITDVDPRVEEFAGLHFINAEISFEQGNGEWLKIHSKVLLETIDTPNGTLAEEQESHLYHRAMKTNPAFRQSESAADDPYVGAMRLHYGYAMTCHKAQGGEWNHVLIHPYQPKNDLRWLYTAITRARKEVCTWVA
jgi:ATP-dependent exoDNAse (exonuclease V) alpha subunit